jgi:exonuclease III
VLESDQWVHGGTPPSPGYEKTGNNGSRTSEILYLKCYYSEKNRTLLTKINVLKWLNGLLRSWKERRTWETATTTAATFKISKLFDFSDSGLNKWVAISVSEMISITIYITLLRQNVESNPGMGRSNKANFSLVTYNCNGLGDPKKLKRVLTKLSKIVENGGIVLLQETHIVDTTYLQQIWKNKFESNCKKTNSAGVIILYKNNVEILHTEKDDEGRYLSVVIKQNGRTLIISNVYFPNDHRKGLKFAEQVYLNILEIQNRYPDNLTFIAGDFNMCMTDKDYINRNSSMHEKILSENISSNNKLLNLVDAYRLLEAEGGYSWNRGNCYSRLDYVFVPKQLGHNIVKVGSNWAFEASDHATIKIDFALNEVPIKGPGIAKVNTNILDDPLIARQIKDEIVEMMKQVDEHWNPHLKLEFLKVAIRTVFSLKTSELRKCVNSDIADTEDEINQLEEIKIKELDKPVTLHPKNISKINDINLAIANLNLKLSQQRKKFSDSQTFKTSVPHLATFIFVIFIYGLM